MARVLIAVILGFLFLQLAVGQQPDDACMNAQATLATNAASCTSASNPRIICSGQCRTYYDDVIDNCPPETAQTAQQTLDAVCGGDTPTASDGTPAGTTASTGGAGVMKGLGMYGVLLISVTAAVLY